MGGTNIRAGLVDGMEVRRKAATLCPSDKDEETVLKALEDLIAEIFCNEVESIGIGVPSVVDPERGIVYDVLNIPSWKEVHLKERLENTFGVPVYVNNDANCFALGSAVQTGCSSLVGLILGTGVGAGIIHENKIVAGANIGAGEIGCIQYRDSDYESYCCGRFFKNAGMNGEQAAAEAKAGKPEAIAMWNEFGKNVGQLLKLVVFAYDPGHITIGGGIASSSELYRDAMMAQLQDFPYPNTIKNLKVDFADNGSTYLIGAANLS